MSWLSSIFALLAGRREVAAPAASTAAPIASAPVAPRAPLPVPAVGDALAAPPPPPVVAAPAVAWMRIDNHRLVGANFDPSPRLGGVITPLFLVMHYTAGWSAANSVRAIKQAGLSAHFFVDRDGRVIQTVPCNRAAYHAGVSAWGGHTDLNRHSIGIEIANIGWLNKRVPDGWTRDGLSRAVPVGQVLLAAHRNGGASMAWEVYPEAQLRALDDLTRAILAAYPTIRDVVGHDDISPGRKQDPGPAFPMARFRRLVG
ncbi:MULTISPECIES: N-acetylmuramoyl-L-alanine amidase [Roseomonadaceae]|uniref:N-acetylmuramoyl-L-alanine amidase n=1 Tax=Falsiroseomonas oleicola TaxID=2801474 RepID=A0ABS6H5P8_9PROT|nr:N-acetylmuramoyl-L-alanine amidase [Roseomonas oleicola]MBU8544010.1 N-acetylmuramoyl-L-alanine amidase [Roseomonas oleicola]